MSSNVRPERVGVLLVEDDELDVEAIRRLFKKHNIDNPLYRASSGVDALEILRGENREKLSPPYILLVDINMPTMNGLEFLKEVRNDKDLKESIAFVLTTSARDSDLASAYELNVAGYFLKDDMNQLVNMFTSYRQINNFPVLM